MKGRQTIVAARSAEKLIYDSYVTTKETPEGLPTELSYKNTDSFNFAFDIVDVLGNTKPGKLALLHLDRDKNETLFTFKQMARESGRAANYFKALGIKKGDRVMLILRRHYQFWICALALMKIGAIFIPATNQLVEHDLTYRFNAAGVSAIVCTALGGVKEQVELAEKLSPTLKTKVLVEGEREGWKSFDNEYKMYASSFERTEECIKGDEPMLMLFTSGTTGYPKIAVHSCKYPLGHFMTGKYWHCSSPEGLHFTISDTGWGKALWGKLFGPWMNETASFVYDFDRFNAGDILPLFAKYHITSFCAPPTMYTIASTFCE